MLEQSRVRPSSRVRQHNTIVSAKHSRTRTQYTPTSPNVTSQSGELLKLNSHIIRSCIKSYASIGLFVEYTHTHLHLHLHLHRACNVCARHSAQCDRTLSPAHVSPPCAEPSALDLAAAGRRHQQQQRLGASCTTGWRCQPHRRRRRLRTLVSTVQIPRVLRRAHTRSGKQHWRTLLTRSSQADVPCVPYRMRVMN